MKVTSKEWKWTHKVDSAFTELNQNRFTCAPILAFFDPQRLVIVETELSDFTLGEVLLERDENCLHPVTFYLKFFSPVEINYEIHHKELLAICYTSMGNTWRKRKEIAQ